VAGRLVGVPLLRAWSGMQAHYRALYGDFPAVPRCRVDNVNDARTFDVIRELRPDLVAVSGTNLLGSRLIELGADSGGMMNLHTGISPYVKGGPNCTNWCLATGRFDLIGNTVMWLDAGIDSGAIIATERTALTGEESLAELHIRVMDHAHFLFARCVRELGAKGSLASVPQHLLGAGTTYFTRQWGALPMLRAIRNHRSHYRAGVDRLRSAEGGEEAVRLVPLQRAKNAG
jgi:folate-dependent phosphoribosylglycinamide formyltransferase PurN